MFSRSRAGILGILGAFVPVGITKPCTVACETRVEDDSEIRSKHFGQWPNWTRKWNSDWDHRHPREGMESVPQAKRKTIHLILIRHGQYDMGASKGLTVKGREQAEITGKRIADLANSSIHDHYGKRKVRIVNVHHSDVTRAKETAKIITSQLGPDVVIDEDPMLAEGWPCIPEPYRDADNIRPSKLHEESARIEASFRKYCHRDTDFKKKSKSPPGAVLEPEAPGSGAGDAADEVEEEYVVLICHQNVIRYFVCRALQLPPEAWLRFRGSNCGITELIISDDGRVALEKFADVGHLPVTHHTFH